MCDRDARTRGKVAHCNVCGAVPVHNHAVRNEDAVQISAVVSWVAEEVQTVAGPGIPELGGTDTRTTVTPHSLFLHGHKASNLKKHVWLERKVC